MALDPRLLRTFLAITREGSISGAARKLNLSQPATSVAVAQLEREIGAVLFMRGRRGIALTPAGEALASRAERMEALLEEAQAAVKLAGSGVVGPLAIGGTPGALVSLVPAAIARLQRERRVAVSVIEGSDAELIELLRRGRIEIAVATTGIEPPPEDIVEITVSRDPFALIVGPGFEVSWPSVSLRDLTDAPWVLPRADGAFHRQIQAMFLAAEAPMPLDVVRCDSLLTSKAIVRLTNRVTIQPRGVMEAELAAGTLRALALDGPLMQRGLGIRMLAEGPRTALAAALIEAMKPSGQP